MRFIGIEQWKKEFPEVHFPLSTGDELRQRADSPVLATLSLTEREWWFDQLTKTESLVFLNWIHSNFALSALLNRNYTKSPFADRSLEQHALFPAFRKFVSPFVGRALSELLTQRGIEPEYLSFAPLLEPQDLGHLETLVTDSLRGELEQYESEISAAQTYEGLIQALKRVIAPEKIAVLNALPPEFYAMRKNWVDAALRITNHPAVTRQLVLQTAKELLKLRLNADHTAELKDFQKDVLTGTRIVEEHKSNWFRIVLSCLGVSALVLGVWWVWSLEPEPVVTDQENNTSFMAFSKEEREKLDSLLQIYKQHKNEEQIDSYDVTIGEELVAARELKNSTAQNLLNAWSYRDTAALKFDTLAKLPRIFPGTSDLRNKKGPHTTYLYNEGRSDLVIVAFANTSHSPVYSAYLAPGQVITFGATSLDLVYVMPGKYAKPGSNYSRPFQLRENQFFDQLGRPAEISPVSPKRFKLIWKESEDGVGYLVDLNSALR